MKPMLFAHADPSWVPPAVAIVTIVIFAVLIVGSFWVARLFLRSGLRALKDTYEGITVHEEAQPGDVELVFHTYFGFFGGGYQHSHHAFLTPVQAQALLKRLHSFNLRWGWFCPGVLFIPFLSYVEYRSQMRVITGNARS